MGTGEPRDPDLDIPDDPLAPARSILVWLVISLGAWVATAGLLYLTFWLVR